MTVFSCAYCVSKWSCSAQAALGPRQKTHSCGLVVYFFGYFCARWLTGRCWQQRCGRCHQMETEGLKPHSSELSRKHSSRSPDPGPAPRPHLPQSDEHGHHVLCSGLMEASEYQCTPRLSLTHTLTHEVFLTLRPELQWLKLIGCCFPLPAACSSFISRPFPSTLISQKPLNGV